MLSEITFFNFCRPRGIYFAILEKVKNIFCLFCSRLTVFTLLMAIVNEKNKKRFNTWKFIRKLQKKVLPDLNMYVAFHDRYAISKQMDKPWAYLYFYFISVREVIFSLLLDVKNFTRLIMLKHSFIRYNV